MLRLFDNFFSGAWSWVPGPDWILRHLWHHALRTHRPRLGPVQHLWQPRWGHDQSRMGWGHRVKSEVKKSSKKTHFSPAQIHPDVCVNHYMFLNSYFTNKHLPSLGCVPRWYLQTQCNLAVLIFYRFTWVKYKRTIYFNPSKINCFVIIWEGNKWQILRLTNI